TVAVREVGLQELHESPKGGERRSHLVRDPRRHPAEKRELVGPLDLLPDAPLLRRIAQQQHGTATGLSPGLALDRHVEEERCPGPRARLHLFDVQRRPARSASPITSASGSLPRATGSGPSTPSSGRPRKRARSGPSRVSAVTLNTRSGRASSTSSIAAGSRARMSLSETKRSIESVRRPTATSSAPSSSGTRWAGKPLAVGTAASVRSTMAQIRRLQATPSASPASPARPPAATAAANRAFWTSGAK